MFKYSTSLVVTTFSIFRVFVSSSLTLDTRSLVLTQCLTTPTQYPDTVAFTVLWVLAIVGATFYNLCWDAIADFGLFNVVRFVRCRRRFLCLNSVPSSRSRCSAARRRPALLSAGQDSVSGGLVLRRAGGRRRLSLCLDAHYLARRALWRRTFSSSRRALLLSVVVRAGPTVGVLFCVQGTTGFDALWFATIFAVVEVGVRSRGGVCGASFQRFARCRADRASRNVESVPAEQRADDQRWQGVLMRVTRKMVSLIEVARPVSRRQLRAGASGV